MYVLDPDGNSQMELNGGERIFSRNNTKTLIKFAKKECIDLTVVGPEDPLTNGVVNKFKKEGLKIFGPAENGARLEGSKSFSKDFQFVLF